MFFSISVAAHSLLESGHCLEAIDYLHKFLEDFTACTSILVESIAYRLLAECYSRQGFHHLAAKTLHHSLKVNPNDIAALYAISQQYKTLQQTESEIECLHLYMKALEEEKDGGKQLCYLPLLEELLLDTVTHSSQLSVEQAFYNFGNRLAELSRHSEASEWYMGLIQKYESKRHHSSCADYLPDFLTICQEASKNLLLANKNEECLFLCNKVLTAFDCGFMSGIDMCEEDFPVISFLEREDMEARQETRTSCQRKRRLSADRQDTEQEQLAWKRMKNSALILACRADAEIMLGNWTAAVQDLTRAIDQLLKYPHATKNAAAEICRSDFALTQSLTPQPKRPRQISDSGDDRESHLSVDSAQSDDWSKMTSTICVKLADALSRQQEDRQALHFSRLAVQMCPGEESALYFLCSSLQRLNRNEEGYQDWLQSRSLPHHTGSVRVQTLLEQRQEELRSTACEVGRNTHHLGHVTDMDKIRLDVSCLQTLLSVRQGR
ncbi:uncharacterized protein LOC112566566 [Pomacea canaliculata]|uniref:uncharacterized protein LOC112566566 n=1 Tax=Pomacea canaliculata TaxID=400727 RepID=UPI000D733BD4|nr:uncharacterized protein LOC112566566 [Pomacea canaliculata]XP_025098582.1 uncharacterized protein LOC112566566 [Pomacea canaliculata]